MSSDSCRPGSATYAFFEILNQNLAYRAFEKAQAITTIFNLAEFNFALKRGQKPYADKATRDFAAFLVGVTIDDIISAMDFRIKHRNLSVPDAIGYQVAKRNNAKFLTGDKEFKNLPNVEFVQ